MDVMDLEYFCTYQNMFVEKELTRRVSGEAKGKEKAED